MKIWAVALLSMVLVGCATTPVPLHTERLFRDHLFAAAPARIGAQGGRIVDNQSGPLTIDFLPGEDIRGQRIPVVTEETIVAMFQCALSPVSDEPVVAAPAIPTLLAIARQRPPPRIFRYTRALTTVSGFVSHKCRVARQQCTKIV